MAALAVAVWVEAASAQQPATPPAETKVDASGGGVTISSGVNSLSIGARAQVRWTVDHREAFDSDRLGSGVGRADGAFSQFDVPRLRLTLAGGVYQPWLKYSFQFDFSRTPGEGASKIKDAIIEFRPTGRSHRVQAGQFKVPFGLQQLTSSGRQQFVDRAITDAKFAPARDIGVMLSGTAAGRKLGYEGGVFNGAGESVRQSRESPLWAGRVFLDPMGTYALAEGAIDAPEKPILHIGVAARGGAQIRGRTTAGIVQSADNQTAFDIEFAYKARRFSSTAEFFWMNDEQQNPVAAADITSTGYHAQAGFMVRPRTTELGIRYARIDGDTKVDDSAVSEFRGVFGYFWRAHNLKLPTSAASTMTPGLRRFPPGRVQGFLLPPPGWSLAKALLTLSSGCSCRWRFDRSTALRPTGHCAKRGEPQLVTRATCPEGAACARRERDEIRMLNPKLFRDTVDLAFLGGRDCLVRR